MPPTAYSRQFPAPPPRTHKPAHLSLTPRACLSIPLPLNLVSAQAPYRAYRQGTGLSSLCRRLARSSRLLRLLRRLLLLFPPLLLRPGRSESLMLHQSQPQSSRPESYRQRQLPPNSQDSASRTVNPALSEYRTACGSSHAPAYPSVQGLSSVP